jgi:hypothetical protein
VTIEIHKPELEALILERMQQGQSIEDILLRAFQVSSSDRTDTRSDWRTMRGMARGDAERLTETLIKQRADENAHDYARIRNQNH